METNEPISQPQQTNVPQTAGESFPQKPTASKPITSWLIVGLILLLIGTTGIFAYKYYELRQQINDKQPVSSGTPTKVVEVSPSPMPSLQPTVDPTANWKTYTNTLHKYLIKVPSDWGEWSVKTGKWLFSESFDQTADLILLGENKPIVKTDEGIIIVPQKIDLSVHLNTTKSEWIAGLQKPEGECSEVPITVGSEIPASKLICPGYHSTTYLIQKDGNLYRITKGKEFAEFDQILSTFKFTD